MPTTTTTVVVATAAACAGAALERVLSGLAELAELDAVDLPAGVAADVLARLEVAARRLAGVRAGVVAAVEADGSWALEGARSMPAWLVRTTASSVHQARAEHTLARAVREHLPHTGRALKGGLIGAEHAQILARYTTASPARLEALAHEQVGEVFLVEQAKVLPAGDFARLVRRWSVAADPTGADEAYREEADREKVVLARTLDGWHLQGWLSATSGAALDAALTARTGVPAAEDARSPAQRRANALTSLARMVLDAGTLTPGAAIRPHLQVHVPYDTLTRLAAATDPALSPVPPRFPGLRANGLRADSAAGDRPDTNRGAGRAGGAFPGGCMPAAGPGFTIASPARRGSAPDDSARRDPAQRDPAQRDPAQRDPGPAGAGAPGPGWQPGGGAGEQLDPLRWRGDTRAGACDPRPSHRAPNPELEPPDLLIPGLPDPATMTGAAAAELEGGTVLPHGLLARLACDSCLARAVFGPDSEVLDSGRTKRLFTPGQRRAIIARDRHCRYPGCNAPPAEGEIHHSIWWYAHGGATRTDDGLLLCWYHHDYVHHRNITIARHPTAHGPRWTFWRPNGNEIVAPLPPVGLDDAGRQ